MNPFLDFNSDNVCTMVNCTVRDPYHTIWTLANPLSNETKHRIGNDDDTMTCCSSATKAMVTSIAKCLSAPCVFVTQLVAKWLACPACLNPTHNFAAVGFALLP